MINPHQRNFYDLYIVAFSGGADSLACLLHLLEIGVPPEKIELWHHKVDGNEGDLLFDWECTDGYVEKLAQSFGVPLYFSWREGGLEREMLRRNSPTAPIWFESPEGLCKTGGNSNKLGTRLQFPQVTASLRTRWCSAYAKIDIMRAAITNQERFKKLRTLIITGERREESPARAKYKEMEFHTTATKSRTIHHWRPVIDWNKKQVWEIIRRWSVNPHVSYKLGWGRCSCMVCIFSSDNQWASAYSVYPSRVLKIADYEKQFGKTISYKTKTAKVFGTERIQVGRGIWRVGGIIKEQIIIQDPVLDRVARGISFPMEFEDIIQARSKIWHQPIFLPKHQWEMPLGAIAGDDNGPS